DQLHTVMDNLDYGVYQDGEENTAQKIFWNIQQLVQAANTYLLLNTIPNSGATYTGLCATIKDLIVNLQMKDSNKIQRTLEKLTHQADGIDIGIQNTIDRCKQLQKKEILLIDANSFNNARTILEQAQPFGILAKTIHETWFSKKPTNLAIGNLRINTNQHEQLLGANGWVKKLQNSWPIPAFKNHYQTINTTHAEAAFILGHNLPTSPQAILWRLVPPNETDQNKKAFAQAFIDKLNQLHAKLGDTTLRKASTQLQALIATAHAVKKSLESQNISATQINLLLYPWRKDINQKLTALEWAILDFHDFYEQQLKIFTDELFIASLLTDNEIVALPSSADTLLDDTKLATALDSQPDPQDITNLKQAQIAHNLLVTVNKAIIDLAFQTAGIPKQDAQQRKLRYLADRFAISEAVEGMLDTKIPDKLGLTTILSDLQSAFEFWHGFLQNIIERRTSRDKSLGETTEEQLKSALTTATTELTSLSTQLMSLQILSTESSNAGLYKLIPQVDKKEAEIASLKSKIAWLQFEKLPQAQQRNILKLSQQQDIDAACGIAALVFNVAGEATFVSEAPVWFQLSGASFKPIELGPSAVAASSSDTRSIVANLPPSAAEIPINPFTVGYYLCSNFIDQAPEFVIFLEISTIIHDLQIADYLNNKYSPAPKDLTPDVKKLVLDFAHNRTWQHLTIIRKAIEKIRARNTKTDTELANKVTQKINTFREKLSTYFTEQQPVSTTTT
ncbi:MAG: hypothetical protein WC630_04280, partial [Candidatus Babeliales bacterium]